jgi:DNA-binding protein YbaB
MLGNFQQLMKAREIQKAMEKQVIEVEEEGVKIKLRGDFKVLSVEIDGDRDERLRKALEKALREALMKSTKQLQGIVGEVKF